MRNPIHFGLDGNCDLLLNFFSRAAGPLRNDGNVVIRDIRVGFHRQIVKGHRPP